MLFTYGAEKLSSVGSLRANLPQEESALLAIVQMPIYKWRESIFLEDSYFPGNHIFSCMVGGWHISATSSTSQLASFLHKLGGQSPHNYLNEALQQVISHH